MASLNSHCPTLGSEVDIYLYANTDISLVVSNFTCRSKIVGIYPWGIGYADYLLAWNNNYTPSSNYVKNTYKNTIGLVQLQSSSFTNDVDQYRWYCWITGIAEVACVHVQSQMVGSPNASTPATLPNIPIAKKTAILKPNVIGEAPCKNPTCGKMNDIGVKSCFWCCVPNPTNY